MEERESVGSINRAGWRKKRSKVKKKKKKKKKKAKYEEPFRAGYKFGGAVGFGWLLFGWTEDPNDGGGGGGGVERERRAFGLWTDESQRIGRLSQTKKGQRNQSTWTEGAKSLQTQPEPPVLIPVRQMVVGREVCSR